VRRLSALWEGDARLETEKARMQRVLSACGMHIYIYIYMYLFCLGWAAHARVSVCNARCKMPTLCCHTRRIDVRATYIAPATCTHAPHCGNSSNGNGNSRNCGSVWPVACPNAKMARNVASCVPGSWGYWGIGGGLYTNSSNVRANTSA